LANRFAATSLEEVLQVLSHLAIKYKQEYKRVPVLIIDNANRLAQKKQEILDHLQDYAKDTADQGTISVVFMSSKGRVPRHYHEDGAKIVRELLKDGSISEDTYFRLVGADIGDKLLETNAFAFRFNSQEITFQSTAVKRFCEENRAYWESGLRTRTWLNW
jgi:hypothetical protein